MNEVTSTLSKPRKADRNRCCLRSRGLTFIRVRSPEGAPDIVSAAGRSGDRSNILALPEDSRPDTDQRGPFFDGDLEIVAHSHGQLGQQRAVHTLCQQAVADVSQRAKIRARLLGGV